VDQKKNYLRNNDRATLSTYKSFMLNDQIQSLQQMGNLSKVQGAVQMKNSILQKNAELQSKLMQSSMADNKLNHF